MTKVVVSPVLVLSSHETLIIATSQGCTPLCKSNSGNVSNHYCASTLLLALEVISLK